MAGYSEVIGRTDVPIPVELANTVIAEAAKQSVVLSRARRVQMATSTLQTPVMSEIPEAYWLNSDTDHKQTTKAAWSTPVMTAAAIAAVIPIPDDVFFDTNISVWDHIQPYLVQAVGKKIDQAAIFGTDKPALWSAVQALVPGATAAGNTVTTDGKDIGVAIAQLAGNIAENDGYNINGFIAKPGFHWRVKGIRDDSGQFIYDQNANTLYGLPTDELNNGAWATTTPSTEAILVDWDKVFIGIRQDITIRHFDQGVISDDTGAITLNLMMQDSQALRVVFRCGFQVFAPATPQGDASRYPAGVVTASP